MNGRIKINGADVSAPKWIAATVPLVTAIIGAIIGVLMMLLVVPSSQEVQAAVENRAKVVDERWNGHANEHQNLKEQLSRMETKLDKLLEQDN